MNKMLALTMVILALGISGCDKKQQAAAPAAAPVVAAPAPTVAPEAAQAPAVAPEAEQAPAAAK